MKTGSKKVESGRYSYKGFTLINCGYYPPDGHVWWQAINEFTDAADYSADTKKELIRLYAYSLYSPDFN